MSTTMEEQSSSWRFPAAACISGKMSTLSIADDDDFMMPEEEEKVDKKFGEEVIGKRIRIYNEGWVLMLKNNFYKYAFVRDDNGTLEILLLKDQMMELGLIEKEEDMDGQKIRVYDEGVVTHFHQKLGMHSVQLENGRTRAFIFHQDHVVWEWEWEWQTTKSSQLPSLKRLWDQDSPSKYWPTTK